MTIRDATHKDAQMLAHLHVQSWQETYGGLLPQSEIAKRDLTYRFRLWTRILTEANTDVAIAPGVGFAQVGPQRDKALAQAGYPRELYSFYVLKSAQGKGVAPALLDHALSKDRAPFSALVLAGNARACAFYEKIGMIRWDTRNEKIGAAAIQEHAYVHDAPDQIITN